MRADGGNSSFSQNDDQIGPADLGQAVGDDKGRPAAGGIGNGALDAVFSSRVDGRGRVVQD